MDAGRAGEHRAWIERDKDCPRRFLAGDMRAITAEIQGKTSDERLIETLTNVDAHAEPR